MLIPKLLLAAVGDPTVDLPPRPQTGAATSGHLRDVLIIASVAAIIALTLFLYVYVTRRGRRGLTESGSRVIYRAERRSRHSHDDSGKQRLRKKRRRREEFANRNPTLGETGGLPPLRPDEPVEPSV